MTAVLIGRFTPGSPEWHAARANGIGGSEVAPILGLSPFESRFSLWHRKRGTVGPVEEDSTMEWGKRLEPAIAEKFADEHPELSPVVAGTYSHSDRPWQIANPDMLLGPVCDCTDMVHECEFVTTALLEVKTSPFGDGWGEAGTDEIPPHVRCQVLWYLDTLDLTVAYVAVLIGGHDYREYVIERDDAECAELRTAVEQFLNDVALDHRPDIDDHGATYQAIRELHPDIDPEEVVLDNRTARRFITAKAAEKAAKAEAREATSHVADAMGSAQRATWDGQTIATRQARDGGIPYVVAARNLPDLREDAA